MPLSEFNGLSASRASAPGREAPKNLDRAILDEVICVPTQEAFACGRMLAAREGLLCGISSADLMPCAFKCLVTLTPQEPTEDFRRRLMITRKEMQRWQKLNMWIVDNRD